MRVIAKDKVKDVLITRTAIKCLVSDHIVEKIIDFQGRDAARAVKLYSEVEFVGWGKFMVSKAKLRRNIESLERGIQIVTTSLTEELTEARRKYLETKLKGMQERLLYLKNKSNNE